MTDILPTPIVAPGHPPVLSQLSGGSPLGRARGDARLAFVSVAGETRLDACYQSGSTKIRLPRVAPDAVKEAVLLNTAGGLTGGDRLVYRVSVGAGSRASVSTQAAERIYRRRAGEARVETRLTVGPGARLDWLPQETILFDNSALSRRLEAEVEIDGTLLAVETIVLGRRAMGETTRNVLVRDSWRVRRSGTLVFADGLRLDGNAEAIMSGGATGGGATTLSTLLLVSPDAQDLLDAVRETLACCQSEGGASAWDGLLVARLLGSSAQAHRTDLIALVERLRGLAMPRVWNC